MPVTRGFSDYGWGLSLSLVALRYGIMKTLAETAMESWKYAAET
jgi:hypothetical protein